MQEEDKDEDQRRPAPAYIINPRNQQEYAQNVRNFVQSQVLPLSDGVMEVNSEIQPLFAIQSKWVQSKLKVAKLERDRAALAQSMINMTKSFPALRPQMERQLAELLTQIEQARAERPEKLTLEQEVRYMELISELGMCASTYLNCCANAQQ